MLHSVSMALVMSQMAAPAPETTAPPAATEYLVSDTPVFSDHEVLWQGFLSGLRGFEGFHEPIGNPLYFESPLNNSEIRVLYLHHDFDNDSVLAGGDLNVAAVQARLALTERLGFIATKDGYSWLDADALPDEQGWNDIAAGLKYVFIADAPNQFLLTGGVRYQFENGDDEILQGGPQEISPFISYAKGWDQFHLMGNLSYRAPLDTHDGNNILQWSMHADYEICKGIAPVIELHGLHYLDDADRTPLSVGGLDYTNLGSTDVGGSTVVWMGVGASIKFTPNVSFGGTYEFALTDSEDDIMDTRVTLSLRLTY